MKLFGRNKKHDHSSFKPERKVNFVIAGAQKAGTSALDVYLRAHPQICMANLKEVHFFDNEDVFKKSETDYAFYHSFFSPNPRHRLLGETTPIYMYWYDAPKRIWEYNPSMKIIIILRNPIERAYSHWNMERARENDSYSFWDAIQSEQQRCRESLPYQHRIYSYVNRGFYTEQLRRVWLYFPMEQTLILRNEDLRHKPREMIDAICGFLAVDPLEKVERMTVHSTPYDSAMDPRARYYLKHVFEYEIRYLERLLDWDCSDWLNC
jgi:hypothetical protein